MRVAVFRARHDGERTAERLRALGHDVLLAPVLEVVPTGAPVPAGPFDGVIFTSAHGVEALPAQAAAPLLGLPCFCVGDRTAAVARAAGFADLRNARADAERLADIVQAALAAPAHLLLVAGRDRKPAIQSRLEAVGHTVQVAELYAARAIEGWDRVATAAMAAQDVDAALHYSRRSAALALQCAQAGRVSADFIRMLHCCLSEDAAAPLKAAGATRVLVATEPDENGLLRMLASGTS